MSLPTLAELAERTKYRHPRMRLDWHGLDGYLGLVRVAEVFSPVDGSGWWWRAEVPRLGGPTREGCGTSQAHAKKQVEEWLGMVRHDEQYGPPGWMQEPQAKEAR